MRREYDYIICGGGLSGLTLAMHLAKEEFADKRVLLIDRDAQKSNDRTWSFWATEDEERYPHLYHKTWDQLIFRSPGFERVFSTAPFKYHTIRGIDFYNHAHEVIHGSSHVERVMGEVVDVKNDDGGVLVTTDTKEFRGIYAFDSIVRSFPENEKIFVWQHFLGWEVTTDTPYFDDEKATLFDFNVDQKDEFRFMYVLPFSKKKAFFEITYFSKDLADREEYVSQLETYLSTHHPNLSYKVELEEYGKIPMTTIPFSKQDGHIIPIGTNNSTVKPSSGYAFVRIQEEIEELIGYIKAGKPKAVKHKWKYISYDKTLLNVLITGKENGRDIFTTMFRDTEPTQVLKFLNEKTSIAEEVRFFNTLPRWSFTRAWLVENLLP